MQQNDSQGKFVGMWTDFMGWVDARFPATETFE